MEKNSQRKAKLNRRCGEINVCVICKAWRSGQNSVTAETTKRPVWNINGSIERTQTNRNFGWGLWWYRRRHESRQKIGRGSRRHFDRSSAKPCLHAGIFVYYDGATATPG